MPPFILVTNSGRRNRHRAENDLGALHSSSPRQITGSGPGVELRPGADQIGVTIGDFATTKAASPASAPPTRRDNPSVHRDANAPRLRVVRPRRADRGVAPLLADRRPAGNASPSLVTARRTSQCGRRADSVCRSMAARTHRTSWADSAAASPRPDAIVVSDRCGFGPAGRAQLGKDVGDVHAHCLVGDE